MAISTVNQKGLDAPLSLTAPNLGTPSAINLANATNLPKAALPTGSVLQVVQATYGTTTSTSSSTYSDTGLSASITPTSSTSKILIFASLASCGKTTGNTFISARLVRNSTAIFGFDDSAVYTNGGSEEAYIGSICTSYLDSPATTSATTYKVQFASGFNAASVRINANIALNSPASVITLMEIAG
jgi:hypothetical protein